MKLWGITDSGLARQQNQDCYMLSGDGEGNYAVCVVCDGMGGAAAGDIASKTALDVFASNIKDAVKPSFAGKTMEKKVQDAVEKANKAVLEMACSRPEYEGMGTTLVCLLVRDSQAVVGNVGDSRAYLLDETGIRQITHDHSLVSEMIQRGEITAVQAQRHPSRNVITRALGVESAVQVDTFKITVRPGQYILLCSDGLSNEVSEPEIYYEVFCTENPENACQTLVDIANSRGGHDNITIVLAAF